MATVLRRFMVECTAYHPTSSATGSAENVMEGGPLDRRGFPLMFEFGKHTMRLTLEEFLAGRAPYVAVAMDVFPRGPRYSTTMRCPELERELNKGLPILFMVVDTGGAFRGKGMGRMDICCSTDKYGCTVIGNDRLLEFYVLGDTSDKFMAGGMP